MVRLEPEALQGPEGTRENLVLQDHQDLKENGVPWGLVATRETEDILEKWGVTARRDHRENQEKRVRMGNRACLGSQEFLADRETLESLEFSGQVAPLVRTGFQVPQA